MEIRLPIKCIINFEVFENDSLNGILRHKVVYRYSFKMVQHPDWRQKQYFWKFGYDASDWLHSSTCCSSFDGFFNFCDEKLQDLQNIQNGFRVHILQCIHKIPFVVNTQATNRESYYYNFLKLWLKLCEHLPRKAIWFSVFLICNCNRIVSNTINSFWDFE